MTILISSLLSTIFSMSPPAAFGPVPTPRQLAWQRMEYGMFCHFGINTFHNQEWTDGTKPPDSFLPTAFNGRQWAEAAHASGMQYLIITAKHHDGFAIYPTNHGAYNVKASPWREGKGDALREVADACHELGLMFGVYLSPWDRHDPLYTDPPAYDERFKAMLGELLTWYAPVGEVWFDGAGSEGHVYDWEGYYQHIRKLAPEALIAICGPDIRWVGNEDGLAPDTLWNTHEVVNPIPGETGANEVRWWPAECDVPIRKGQWFYHTDSEHNLRSLDELLEIYYRSVGRGAALLLNVSPDRRGLLPESDTRRLEELWDVVSETFKNNLAENATLHASHIRGDSKQYGPGCLVDNNQNTFWSVHDDTLCAWVEVDFREPKSFDRLMVQEHIALGQRVQAHEIQVFVNDHWQSIAQSTTIGYKRIHILPPTTAQKVRLHITASKATPILESIGIYRASSRDLDWSVAREWK